ncbi:unnamed protein product, partial [Scytosiphon promiscuus]
CSNGLPGLQFEDSVCCELQCGTCGGVGCDDRPGGGSACCSGDIMYMDAKCSATKAAPCVI